MFKVLTWIARDSFVTITAFDSGDILRCDDGDRDSRFNLAWTTTLAGRKDSQPCPTVAGVESTGFASRLCDIEGEWEDQVDVLNCRSVKFDELENSAVRVQL